MSPTRSSVNRALSQLIGFLVVSAIYLYAFPQANVFYAGVVLLHAVTGVVASVLLLFWLARSWRRGEPLVPAALFFLFPGPFPARPPFFTASLPPTLLSSHLLY